MKKMEKTDHLSKVHKKNKDSIFLQQLSTEIRSALSGIVAVTDELKTSLSGADSVIERIHQIEESSDALYNIANSIIDYTDLSKEKFELVNTSFNVKTLMSNLLTGMDAVANRKNVQLFTNVRDAEEVQIDADRSRFEQVMKGYIEYALDHSPSEGNVFIILRYKYLSRNTVKVIVEIETAGTKMYHAISRDYAFLHQKKYVDFRYGGKGINLYICNRLLEIMGGTIEYSSQNEFESRMSLSFDMEKVSSATDEEKKKYSFADERLMIIDVDNDRTESNNIFFNEIGIRYDISRDFDEAMDLIGQAEEENDPYSICLLKWNSSNMDTMEIVSEIRSVFGNDLIIMAVDEDETVGVEVNKLEGLNYLVAQSWIRSLIFDTLIKLKKGELGKTDYSALEKEYNFENRRVLLAEDVLLNAELVIKMLNSVNISVTEAVNGLEAVSIYNKKPEGYFNCILMDINMPVMDGYSATREIRNSGKADAKSVPIFAMTANAMAEDIQQAIDAGMDGHIAKPVEIEKLYALLNKTFSTMENDQFIDLKKQAAELQQKNEELLRKAEHDHLTGLLNRHGFDRKIASYSKCKEPIGLMLIDLDKFKGINDTYGHQIGDRVLQKLALTLQKYFRATDDIIRFGGDEFAIILTKVTTDRSFVINNVEEINKDLSNPQDGLPPFSISTGVAFSETGYSKELYNKADQALYTIKEHGRCGCKVYSETEEPLVKAKTIVKRTANAMLYLNDDDGKLLLEKDAMTSTVLEANGAVGTASGFYDNELSAYYVSRYLLNQLGYTFDEFLEATNGKFKQLIYTYDRLSVYGVGEIGKIHTAMIRLIHQNGEPIWFHSSIVNTYSSDGRKMWLSSFRKVDTALINELCENDCTVVGMISLFDKKIIIEKGAESLKGYSMEMGMRYDYDTLLRFSVNKQIESEQKEDIYQKSCIQNVVQELEHVHVYSFIAGRTNNDGNRIRVRYRFRYIDYQQDAILCTQEFISSEKTPTSAGGE